MEQAGDEITAASDEISKRSADVKASVDIALKALLAAAALFAIGLYFLCLLYTSDAADE